MTLGIRQLAMFASKNKQVVQIRIQVSQVEAVLERWSLRTWPKPTWERSHWREIKANFVIIGRRNSIRVSIPHKMLWKIRIHDFFWRLT